MRPDRLASLRLGVCGGSPDGGRELFDEAAQGRLDAFFLGGGQIDGDGNLNLDFDDEIVDAACITHDGKIRGERTAGATAAKGG